MSRKPEFWGTPGDRHLSCTSVDEAVEMILERSWPDRPEHVVVAGFAPISRYLPHVCEEVCRHTVDVWSWCRQYRPDLLGPEEDQGDGLGGHP
jgi:hypothetical protein